MKRFALAGNPNSGKTTLFNSLTGSTAHVGNWPGVTVDKREGTYKKCPEPIAIVDLPGIYSLSPYTSEEVVSRNFILDEKPDCVIDIIDATNLERNLYLTTQLLEIDVPVIIALNMIDAVEKSGDRIDAAQLEKRLGVPVVKISALRETGLDELMKKGYETSLIPRKGVTVLENCELKHLIGDVRIALDGQKIGNPLFHAIKLVENDELEVKMHPDATKTVDEFKKTFVNDTFGTDFEALVADARYNYISKYYSPALEKNAVYENNASYKADKIFTNRWFAIPAFLLILFAVFHLTFSENLFFLGGLLGDGFVTFGGTAFEGALGSGGINSPGAALQCVLTVGTDALKNLASSALASSPGWLSGFVVDGVLEGLFAILSFVPQILLLFLFFSILEDTGYMARIAFILDRLFRRFGLSGRAFMPMIMGFGCSVPAMINTRTLADENERIATIRVIPFFSCGAKLPILTAISGGLMMRFNVGNADVITYSMYVLGVAVALISVLIMHNTTLKGEIPPFIMELPAYHLPQFKNLMLHLWDKLKHFLQKAFTVILASTIVIWFISHFSFSWEFLPDERTNESILAGVGQLLQPLFTPLGFGSQLGEGGWIFVVAVFMGLIAKENVVATFGTMGACILGGALAESADGGVSAISGVITLTGITPQALIAFIAFNMLTVPCAAAVATARAELGSAKRFRYTLLFWLAVSYLAAAVINVTGTYPWTSVVVVAALAAVIAAVLTRNKKRTEKR